MGRKPTHRTPSKSESTPPRPPTIASSLPGSDPTRKPFTPITEDLTGFLKAVRGRSLSQEQIIIEFLDAVINVDAVSDHGSVLINHPRSQKLVLFNEGDFLFKRGMLGPAGEWKKEFTYFEGIAGRCFRTKTPTTYSKQDQMDPARGDFVPTDLIENMVCLPILTTRGDPFGVVCFHNNDPERKFERDEVARLESYADILALALHMPHPELQLERNVFIVHGKDENALLQLQVILQKNGVNPRVLVEEDKSANSILRALEDLMRVCKAGFILATPDDEGRRFESEEQLERRARENVVFETGLLFAKYREFERVTILLKEPLKLPSDLKGIAYEPFTNIRDIEMKIVNKLKHWGLAPPAAGV